MQFIPYVLDHDNNKIEVTICPMTIEDAYATEQVPVWQTSWKSDYLQNPKYEKYAVKVSSELVALGAYEVQKTYWSYTLFIWKHSQKAIQLWLSISQNIQASENF